LGYLAFRPVTTAQAPRARRRIDRGEQLVRRIVVYQPQPQDVRRERAELLGGLPLVHHDKANARSLQKRVASLPGRRHEIF